MYVHLLCPGCYGRSNSAVSLHSSSAAIAMIYRSAESLWVSDFWWRTSVFACYFLKTLPVFHPRPQNELCEWLGQQSLDGGVDVPSRGDERLQVGFAVDEAHGVELVELLLETDLWGLKLWVKRWHVEFRCCLFTEGDFFFFPQALFSEWGDSSTILTFAFPNIIELTSSTHQV